MLKLTLVVLTGGNSKRFGDNKCLYKIGGKTMIEMIVDSIGKLFSETIFVGSNPQIGVGKFLRDIHPNRGPVGGLETALINSKYESIFLIACDMPFVSFEVVKNMIEVRDEYSILCPLVENIYQVTHAIYSKSVFPAVVKELKREKPSLTHIVLHTPNTLFLDENHFKHLEGYRESFKNFNFKSEIKLYNTENPA